MSKRNLTLSELTGPDLNISLGLIDDITQKLKDNGHINATDVDGLEAAIEEFLKGTPTTTHVNVSHGNNTLLAANSNRKLGTEIRNSTNMTCYMKLGTSASGRDFSETIKPLAAYYMTDVIYQGQIDGYFMGLPTGEITVTEFA